MASRRGSRSGVAVDLGDVAQVMRTAAEQIRRDALALYELAVDRAATLDAAAAQIERPLAAPPGPDTAPSPTAATTTARPNTTAGRPAAAKRATAKRAAAAPAKNTRATTAAPATKTATVEGSGQDTLTDRVVAVVRGTPGRSWTTAEVATVVGAAPNTVSTYLARAATRGLITRVERGTYQAA
jgi:hypothetical protein